MQRITVGKWRTTESGPMQVVSGPIGREKVHFHAPDANRLPLEMKQFLKWFNASPEVDPVIKTAIAHFWFVTIHPFDVATSIPRFSNSRISRRAVSVEHLASLAYFDEVRKPLKSSSIRLITRRCLSLTGCSLIFAQS